MSAGGPGSARLQPGKLQDSCGVNTCNDVASRLNQIDLPGFSRLETMKEFGAEGRCQAGAWRSQVRLHRLSPQQLWSVPAPVARLLGACREKENRQGAETAKGGLARGLDKRFSARGLSVFLAVVTARLPLAVFAPWRLAFFWKFTVRIPECRAQVPSSLESV